MIMEVSLMKKNKEYKILIDDEDYDKIKDLTLNISVESAYRNFVIDSKTGRRLHRFLIPSKSNEICIHKNNNKFDFRKENLFITTQKELKDLVRNGEIKQRFDELDRLYYEF